MRTVVSSLVLAFVFAIGAELVAAPVEITTEEGLSQLLSQLCQIPRAEQTPSGTREQAFSQENCFKLRERLERELRERLREHGSLIIDPEVLYDSVALGLQWLEDYGVGWGVDEAAEFVVGLTELAKQYGRELKEFLTQAAGYSPEEVVQFVAKLAQQVTEHSAAKEALEEVLESIEEISEEVGEPAGEIEENHHEGRQEENHGPAYKEDKGPKEHDEEAGEGSDHHKGGADKGGKKGADDDDDDKGNKGPKGDDDEEGHGKHHEEGDED